MLPLLFAILRLKDLHFCEVTLKYLKIEREELREEQLQDEVAAEKLKLTIGVATDGGGGIKGTAAGADRLRGHGRVKKIATQRQAEHQEVKLDSILEAPKNVKVALRVLMLLSVIIFAIAMEGISSAACTSLEGKLKTS